jgi:hypothetical protein
MGRMPRDLHPLAWWAWAIGLATYASFLTNPVLLPMLMVVSSRCFQVCMDYRQALRELTVLIGKVV